MKIIKTLKIKKISIAYLLLVLLGIVGGHKFYLKKYAQGFAYIFTLGFFGIGTLLDFITLSFQVIDFNILVNLLNNDTRFIKYKSRFCRAAGSSGLIFSENGLLALKRNFCEDFEVLHVSELAGFSSSTKRESKFSVINAILAASTSKNRRTFNRARRPTTVKKGILTLKFNDFDNPLFNLEFPTVEEAKNLLQILKNLKKSHSSKINIDEYDNEEKDEIDVDECMDRSFSA